MVQYNVEMLLLEIQIVITLVFVLLTSLPMFSYDLVMQLCNSAISLQFHNQLYIMYPIPIVLLGSVLTLTIHLILEDLYSDLIYLQTSVCNQL